MFVNLLDVFFILLRRIFFSVEFNDRAATVYRIVFKPGISVYIDRAVNLRMNIRDISLNVCIIRKAADTQNLLAVYCQADSRLLAGFLQQTMNAALAPAKPRSAHTGEYYLLEHLQIPAVLVECGFLSNPAEEQKLLTADYQRRVAESIAAGVEAFVGAEKPMETGKKGRIE